MQGPSFESPRRGRVVGVIDLCDGRAVHARGGDRKTYLPVAIAAGIAIDGDAMALARTYVEKLGVRELYVADLDAITRGIGALQTALLSGITKLGVPVWVDAGVTTIDSAHTVITVGASVVVVGLETLQGFEALERICAVIGGTRVAFSVDLRDGVPIVGVPIVAVPNADHAMTGPLELALRAARAGAGTIIVLDVARVGTQRRVDTALLARIRLALPEAALFVGGGVRDAADLEEINAAGADGTLIATALLTGAIHV